MQDPSESKLQFYQSEYTLHITLATSALLFLHDRKRTWKPKHESTQSQLELIMISGQSKRIHSAAFYHEAIILNSHKQRSTISTYYIPFCSCLWIWTFITVLLLVECFRPRGQQAVIMLGLAENEQEKIFAFCIATEHFKNFNPHND